MKQRLLEIINGFAEKKLLVVGDAMLDEYIIGDAERISPEAPIPVVLAKERKFVLGGAANTANNIAALGARAVLCGILGKDSAAEKITDLLKENGIVNNSVIDEKRQTTRKARVIARNQQMLRIDAEESSKLSESAEKELLEKVSSAMKDADAVVVSDYAKGALSKKTVKEILKNAWRLGKIVCVDSKDLVELGFKNATLLKPNKKELAKETGLQCGSLQECKKAAQKLFAKLKPKALLVTLGVGGMLLVEKGKETEIKSRAVEVFDVSGAGDTVLATASLALACNASALEAAELANFAASVVIKKFGTATLSATELKGAIENGFG